MRATPRRADAVGRSLESRVRWARFTWRWSTASTAVAGRLLYPTLLLLTGLPGVLCQATWRATSALNSPRFRAAANGGPIAQVILWPIVVAVTDDRRAAASVMQAASGH